MQKHRLSSQHWASDHRKKSQDPFNTEADHKAPREFPLRNGALRQDSVMTRRYVKSGSCPRRACWLMNRSMWVGTYPPHQHLPVPVEASATSQVVIPSPYQQASTNQSKLQRPDGYVSMQSRPKSQKMLTYFESKDSHLPLSCLSCDIIPSCPSHPSPGTFWLI